MKKSILMSVVCLSTIFLLAASVQSEEQSKSINNPIETGFVFVDGKYIDAPYIVERRGLVVYLNNIPIREKKYYSENDFYIEEDPGDLNNVSKYAGLSALDTLRGENGYPHMCLKVKYLYQHYPEDIALQKINEYFRNLPFLKKVEKFAGEEMIKVTDYYNQTRIIDNSLVERSSIDEIVNSVQYGMEDIIQSLRQDHCHFFFKGGEISFSEIKAAVVLPKAISALKDNSISNIDKKAILEDLQIVRSGISMSDTIVDNFEENSQLEIRLRDLRKKISEDKGQEFLINFEKNLLNESSGKNGEDGSKQDCFSPDGTDVYFYYANAFQRPWEAEIASIKNNIEEQEPDKYTYYIFHDLTENDDNPGLCTLANFINCKYADILSIHSHGAISFFMSVYLKEQTAANDWCSGEDNMYVGQSSVVFWDNNPAWYVATHKQWAEDNLSPLLTQSFAIVFVNSCRGNAKSDGTSFLTSCLGRVGFGYPDGCNMSDRIWNNNELLGRMNGTIGNGEFRSADEAYCNMSYHADDMEIEGHGSTSLCPATYEYFPEDGDVVDDSGTGYFQSDTYCHDYESADEALTFEKYGSVTIDNIHWVGNNQVNRIEYDWNGTEDFLVTVNVSHDKFDSWGAATTTYHHLDFDRVAPATEDGEYHFSHEHNGDINTASSISIPHNEDYAIEFEDDADFYEMNFNGGSTYIMYTELIGDSDLDPAFYLFNSNLEEIEYDDDTNGLQPYIEIYIDVSGSYYLRVAYCYNDLKGTKGDPTGDYKLIIKEQILTPPELLEPENFTQVFNSVVEFSWEEVSGATQYKVQIAYDSDFNLFFQGSLIVYDNYAYVTGFPNDGTPFYWHVRAEDGIEWSDYSDYNMFYNGGVVIPDIPWLISPYDNSEQCGKKITFIWECSAGTEYYELEVAYDEDFIDMFYSGMVSTNCCTVSGFPNNEDGTDFYWRVNAYNSAGWSGYSETYHFINKGIKITFHVPSGDYPTIQSAINDAFDGYTVLVEPGTYVENIRFYGKSITVISSEGPEVTIIDGNNNGSVVTFESGEDESAVLSGFTLTNGNGNYVDIDNSGTFVHYGGGIFCNGSDPTLENLIITGNSANSDYSMGGGIFCYFSNPFLKNVEITNNLVRVCGGGVSLYYYSDAIFDSVTIYNNSTHGYSDYNKGGGVYIYYSSPYFKHTLISENKVTGYSGQGQAYGGGIFCGNSSPTFENITIANNTSKNGGREIHCVSSSSPSLVNSIIWDNSPIVIYSDNSSLISATYSDIRDGWNGIGNIDEDPLFFDPYNGDFHLTVASPCVNAGDPSSPLDPDGTVADMGAFYLENALIEGYITLSGGGDNARPLNEVIVKAGEYHTNPDESGYYSLEVRAGSYDVIAILPGYGIQTEENVEVVINDPSTVDFNLNYNGYIIVSQDGSGHFSHIQEGVSYALNNEILVINEGIYEEDIMVYPSTSPFALTIRGYSQFHPENTIIVGSVDILADNLNLDINYVTLNGNQANDTAIGQCFLTLGEGTITLKDNIIKNYLRHGIQIPDECSYYFEITENIIENCEVDVTNIGGNEDCYGAGIYCCSSSLIQNNIIRNNIVTFDGFNHSYGGGIYINISADPDEHVIIENNQIYSNSAYEGGAIFCTGDGEIVILGNDIYDNTVSRLDTNSGDCVGIFADHCTAEITISSNCLYGNIDNLSSSVICLNYNLYSKLYNNTIAYNANLKAIEAYGGTATIRNNIITENEYGIVLSGCDDTIQYCNVHNNGVNYSNCTPGVGCIEENPLFNNPSNYDFSLEWDEDGFSPCIDTGDPEMDWDADDTPPDMGAIPATTHYFFKDDYDDEEFDCIDWISFPVLNTITNDYTEAIALLTRQNLIIPGNHPDDILAYVEYEDYSYIKFENNSWQNNLPPDGDFHSEQGYIFHLQVEEPYPVKGVSGIWKNETTPITLYANKPEGNWIGCFLTEPALIQDAFESIWDEWTEIRSEHWAITREQWEEFQRRNWTVNPGELYIVKVENECNLVWNKEGSVPPFTREQTDYFTYVETADYMPILVDTAYSDTTIAEIAVFCDDECLGATKVTDGYPVQILAYTPTVARSDGGLEFRILYDDGKRNLSKSIPYIMYNSDVQAYLNQPLYYQSKNFEKVQLNTSESTFTPIIALKQNYPNPVRSSFTSISFLPDKEAQHTEVTIYNIKGQLIKNIDCNNAISKGMESGYYTIQWDCCDEHGREISNGIYFYRLTSGNKNRVHKMLIMK